MRTLIIIIGGLLLLGLFVLVGRVASSTPAQATAIAALAFIPVWLIVAAGNTWIGVSRAGYSIAEELPILLVIFAIPAAAAAFVWWRAGRG